MFPELTDAEVDYVIGKVLEWDKAREVNAPYRVVVVGMGKRGMHHAAAFAANPRFELVGICEPRSSSGWPTRPPSSAGSQASTDAAALASEVKPDVFCFCTPPNVRLPLDQDRHRERREADRVREAGRAVEHEGLEIKQALDAAGVKAVVSHQHRYGEHYKKVKEIIASGAIGRVHTVYGTRRAG